MPIKFNVNHILKPFQVKLLQLFFATDFARPFFLTGGTALAAFYLGHRESKDFDFFSLEQFDPEAMKRAVDEIAAKAGASVNYKVRSQTYNEVYLTNKKEKWEQRIDFVLEQPVYFGRKETIEGIVVDNLKNIGSNKILAIYGRFKPKDYIDLYFLIKKAGFKFDRLFEMAKRKDLGLFEFYFANCLYPIDELEVLPRMKQVVSIKKLTEFYRALREKLLEKAKPLK